MPRSLGGPRGQRGVGLVEVLVAVLILSVGLLGISFVQVRSLSGNNSAMGRSMAVIASYSILEAMRADRANALAGSYNLTIVADDNCTGVPDDASFAAVQLTNWCVQMRGSLGTSDYTEGTVDCDATGDCTVTVQFDDSRVGSGIGNSTAEQVITRAFL